MEQNSRQQALRLVDRACKVVSGSDGQPSPEVCPTLELPAQRIGFDNLDRLALALLPSGTEAVVVGSSTTLATNIVVEGGAGSTVLRMLAREVALRRVRVRTYSGLMDIHATRATKDPSQIRLARLYATIADNERRALTSALDQLARLGRGSGAITISADQAAVWIGSEK